MAHANERVGMYSQNAAKLALIAQGYTVAEPETAEAFDLYAECPESGRIYKCQVKTIHRRKDRGGEFVVFATKGGGQRYTQSDTDYFIGVLGSDDAPPRVFMFENRGLAEYWSTEARAPKRWRELSIGLSRDFFAGLAENTTKTEAM